MSREEMTNEKLEILKDFLTDAEKRWPLTMPENRERAREWVEFMKLYDPIYADKLEKLILSYERPI